jgi:hypothetical protein
MRVRPGAKRAPPAVLSGRAAGKRRGLRPNAPGLWGRTTLHVAVSSDPKVVRFAGYGVCAPKSGESGTLQLQGDDVTSSR